jgi:hypothetical protein
MQHRLEIWGHDSTRALLLELKRAAERRGNLCAIGFDETLPPNEILLRRWSRPYLAWSRPTVAVIAARTG